MEKRGNSEAVIKRDNNGYLTMTLPGSDNEIEYDGRFNDKLGIEKLATLKRHDEIIVEL